MASKKQKRKNRAINKAQATAYQASQKTYTGGGFGYYSYSSNGRQYRADEYSASLAYTFNVAVNRSVEFWEQWLNGLKWEIRDGENDSVLIASDNRRIPNTLGAHFAHAVKQHRRYFKHGYFTSLAFSDSLYGESYTYFICDDYGNPKAIEWINPLAIEPQITSGRIQWYQYNDAERPRQLKPYEIAYRIAKRDSLNDLRGLSRVMSVIDSLNIEATEKESLKAWFRNNMQLGGLISPSNPDINMSIGQTQKLEDDFRRDNKGVVNAGRWAIAPANMTVTPFPAPDIEKNFQLLKPLRDEIQMAMGTYPQLVGDPSAANYDSAYDIKRQWWELLGIPYAHDIEDYINEQILPILEPRGDCYFAFVLTPYEVEEPEVVNQDLGAGVIDMFEAARLRGYNPNQKLKGVYLINSIPMHEDIIAQLAQRIPSQYALDYANAQEARVNADASNGTVKPIVQAGLENPVTPSGDSLPIETKPNSEITTYYQTSKTSESYLDKLRKAPSIFDFDPHNRAHNHELPAIAENSNADALEELEAWRKFCMNGKNAKRAFSPNLLRGDMANMIQAAIDSKDKQAVLNAFKFVFDLLKSGYSSLADELGLWKFHSLARFKLGEAQEPQSFKSAVIPSLLYEAISGALEDVKSIDEIYNIFADAEHWESHSHA